jgi:uncharacterized protein YcbK (DUF882 family)
MSAGHARLDASLTRGSCLAGCFALAALLIAFGYDSVRTASAEGETRTLSMHHLHTDESITITYKRNGHYDEAALKKLNWFLRDWRRQEETRMDPRLFDIIWEVTQQVHAQKPLEIVCGYRAPATNEMLRKHSNGVAKASLHTHGQAMDFYIPDVSLVELRYAGLRLQRGGVGFYPASDSPFVHLDTGNIRHWPEISRQELVQVFPNGRTVHIPDDGQPLAGYALALNDIEKRGSSPSQSSLDAAASAGIVPASKTKNPVVQTSDADDDAPAAMSHASASKAPAPVRTAAAEPVQTSAPLPLASVPLPRKRPAIPAQTVAQNGSPAVGSSKGNAPAGPWDRGQGVVRADAASADGKSGGLLAYAPDASSPRPGIQVAESIVAKTPAPTRVHTKPIAVQGSTPAIVASSAKQNTDDLWTRAMMMTPDLQYYMSATLLGRPDYKQLRQLMQKPAMALAMSFSDDPMQGVTTDRFSGDTAVVFLATVPVTTTQSAMLQQ